MSLPSGYTQLEYIESSGTQYVDSGIVADISTVVSIEFSLTSSGITTIVGWVQGADSGPARTALFQYNGQWFLDFGGESNRLIGGTISANMKYSVEFGNFYVKNLATGTNILTGSALSSGNFGTGSLCLCGEVSGLFSSGKWYGWKIQKGGTLVRDFVPCKNASGTVGLWDDVGSQFYQNAGTGTFTAGPQVLGSHKTMVGGTIYDVTGGKCMVGGTVYDIQKGLTMVGGTVYEIQFSRGGDGLTWYLNETVDVSTDMSIDIGFCVVSTGERFTGIGIISILGRSLVYKIESNSFWDPVFSVATWDDEKYRTITFDEAPTGTLLEWLQENGKAI